MSEPTNPNDPRVIEAIGKHFRLVNESRNPNRAAITWLEKAIECMDKAQGIVNKYLSYHPDFEYVERALNQLNTDACEAIDDIEGLGP